MALFLVQFVTRDLFLGTMILIFGCQEKILINSLNLWNKGKFAGYVLQNSYNKPEFSQNFTKICKDNTTYLQCEKDKKLNFHKGIFIDIFPIDRVAPSKFGRILQNFDAIFMMLYTRKYIPPTETGLRKIISKIALSVVPKSKYDILKLKFEKALIKKSGNDTGYRCFDTFGDVLVSPFTKDMFDELINIEFEDCIFLHQKILQIYY